MKKTILFFAVIFFLLIVFPKLSNAQCAMCQRNAETSLKAGDNTARGLNTGILYMMMVPYTLIGGIGYWWYKNRKDQAAE